jgi:drug/metabolite transporter (DMT)-like permease
VRVRSSVVAVYILLQPLVAGVLGRIILGERLGPHAALAGTLIVAGVMLSAWKRA